MRFCMYCSKWRDPAGFKTIFHLKSGSKRGMCEPCQEMRKRPRDELEKLALKQKTERKN